MDRYLITGITGQDGTIAKDLLERQGHEVYGITHGQKNENSNIIHWDWNSEADLNKIIEDIKPTYILNFAAYHHPSSGNLSDFKVHERMLEINVAGLSKILRSILSHKHDTMIVHCASSQIYTATSFGESVNESSEVRPSTFYGVTKKSGMDMIDYYRRHHGLEASTAILFNHESEKRDHSFLTRTISNGVAKIAKGIEQKLKLRNIGASADFMSARDTVQGILDICSGRHSSNYIIASGHGTSVRELVSWAFEKVNLNWENHLEFERDETSDFIVGNSEKLVHDTNWSPRLTMKEVIQSMVENDLSIVQ